MTLLLLPPQGTILDCTRLAAERPRHNDTLSDRDLYLRPFARSHTRKARHPSSVRVLREASWDDAASRALMAATARSHWVAIDVASTRVLTHPAVRCLVACACASVVVLRPESVESVVGDG